jgi:putative SOS response-associated peptidase YedK
VEEFCEWSGEKGSKQEHWFGVPAAPIFSFPGIWRPTAEGGCCVFLTREADPLAALMHEKAMPVICTPRIKTGGSMGRLRTRARWRRPFLCS